MPRHSYREHDYAFGQAMFKLRTSIGLTQASLAGLLGVSRRTVGEWEGGLTYPTVEHLQHVLGVLHVHKDEPVPLRLFADRKGSPPQIPEFVVDRDLNLRIVRRDERIAFHSRPRLLASCSLEEAKQEHDKEKRDKGTQSHYLDTYFG